VRGRRGPLRRRGALCALEEPMRPGDRVIVTAQWSSFFGMKGAVAAVRPHLMILVDGDSYPIRVGPKEVTEDERPTEPNMSGAE
jgi:hypothetical protein